MPLLTGAEPLNCLEGLDDLFNDQMAPLSGFLFLQELQRKNPNDVLITVAVNELMMHIRHLEVLDVVSEEDDSTNSHSGLC